MRVAVACSPRPGVACEVEVALAAGMSVFDAVRASGLLERYPEVDISTQSVGVWGRRCALDTLLHEGDRVEIYRPLLLDPMEARRRRAERR